MKKRKKTGYAIDVSIWTEQNPDVPMRAALKHIKLNKNVLPEELFISWMARSGVTEIKQSNPIQNNE